MNSNLNPWSVVENEFNLDNNYTNESIFSTGNGYIGFRGNFEEAYDFNGKGVDGTYINGFYESDFIKYPEIAYGYAEKSQTMLNVANAKIIRLEIDGEQFNMLTGTVTKYERILDMKSGILTRRLEWRSPGGKEIAIDISRFVSLADKHIAAIRYSVTPLNFSGGIVFSSEINGDVTNLQAEADPRVGSGLKGRVLDIAQSGAEADCLGYIVQKARRSKMVLACAAANSVFAPNGYTSSSKISSMTYKNVISINADQGQEVAIHKFISFTDSRDFSEDKLGIEAVTRVISAKQSGFEALVDAHTAYLSKYWRTADIQIDGNEMLQQGIRFNMLHLLQSAGKDGRTNIGAKGLTGEGYEGHYFWDTEMYILPFFMYSNPDISRKLLESRYAMLDAARGRARQLAHDKGALFPWRTIDGGECSANYPSGTAQYHINADIAYAVYKYIKTVDDIEFMVDYGAEILIETARLWADLGCFIPSKANKFCINGVTGPDEYNTIVNNNLYTNMMARANMDYAAEIVSIMKCRYPSRFEALAEKIGFDDSELEFWKRASSEMYIPYDDKLNVHMQDDGFMDRAPWDFENVPKENYPLLLHYHPLVIYRHQVCKQADMVLTLFLLGEHFTDDEKKRDYDYYEKCTTHDSSLSTSIFSIMASEIGYYDKAYDYFIGTARMDLDDTHKNTKDGIHAANMAGTWMCVVNGFAGMRNTGSGLSFKPYLPEGWNSYSFKTMFCGSLISVSVKRDVTEYELIEGSAIDFLHCGKDVSLCPAQPKAAL